MKNYILSSKLFGKSYWGKNYWGNFETPILPFVVVLPKRCRTLYIAKEERIIDVKRCK